MKSSATHLPSLLGSILFFLSGLFTLGISLFMGGSALLAFSNGRAVLSQETIIFVTFGFEAALLFAATYFLLQKAFQKPSADRELLLTFSPLQIFMIGAAGGLSILLGNWVGTTQTGSLLVLPILTIPAVVLPLAALLALGTYNIPSGTRWQSWSVLGLGMSLVPLILLFLEALIAVILFAGLLAYLTSQPELMRSLEGLVQQIMILGPQSERARALLTPLLTRPTVIAMILVYTAILVPAVEELFKPLGVWLLAGRLDSPARGFALGALSGAGYALIETIGVSGQGGEWAGLLFTRIGTGLLHITTSALMGAAILFAWRQRRYLRLFVIYTLAILLHGLWNTAAMLFTLSSFAEGTGQVNQWTTLQPLTVIMMSLLTVALFVILVVANRQMRKTVPSSSSGGDESLPYR